MPKASALASKLNALQLKEVKLVTQESPPPAPTADPLSLFETNSAAKYDSANTWTLDVFPSQQTIFCFLMLLASSASSAADHKEHAKSSLATFALYYMTIYHAFFLINDLHVRPNPSAHARIWQESSFRHNFAKFLESLPVPESMETIFAQLFAAQSDRTPNVFYIPSAAGFRHDMFFGRFFPLSIFTNLHDCIATVPGNSSRMTVTNDLFSRPLYTIKTTPNDDSPFVAQLPHLLGITHDNAGTYKYYASKVYQIFSTIFNPVLFRDFHRRSSLAALDIKPPTFVNANALVNAYDVLFCATPHNLAELKVVLSAVSSILVTTVPCKRTLSQVIASSSGISILDHGYSDFALPTWNASPSIDFSDFDTDDKDTNVIKKLNSSEPLTYAETLRFLTTFPDPRPAASSRIQDFTQNPAPTNIADIQTTRTWPWSLISNNNPRRHFPIATSFVTFDEQRSAYPHVLILDVTGNQTVNAHLASLTHKIIESFEIDGCTIEMPRSDRPLGLQNCSFADSCIPYKYVHKGTSFLKRPNTEQMARPLLRSKAHRSTNLPASSLLIDRTKVFLPLVPGLRIIDDPAPSHIPGLTQLMDNDWIKYAQSFLGFSTDSTKTPGTDVANMTDRHLYLFSPYTFTPVEDDDQEADHPDYNKSVHYFITNLRSVFGTDVNLIEVNHPLEALPVL
nr:capsid protein [Sarcosphaera coronaria partitivirus]